MRFLFAVAEAFSFWACSKNILRRGVVSPATGSRLPGYKRQGIPVACHDLRHRGGVCCISPWKTRPKAAC
jgi:hypothetical protein